MSDVSLWGEHIPTSWLSPSDAKYLESLPDDLPSIDWIWQEMDRVWESFDLDNRKPLAAQRISDFYSHPVWLMNGIYTSRDPVSVGHRVSIAKFLVRKGAGKVADYGGGFGELALEIVKENPDAKVSIIEPYPTLVAKQRVKNVSGIEFASDVAGPYDALVAQDVLEHVEDPIAVAYQIASGVRKGGMAVFGNCFRPVIQCHLPSTFHLRHTFAWVMRAMGLNYIGTVEGAIHVQVFTRRHRLRYHTARRAERVSQVVGSMLNSLQACLREIRQG